MTAQADRDKALAMFEEIITRLKRIEAHLGLEEPQQLGNAPVAGVLKQRAARTVEKKRKAKKK
jgi:hypothetical protein